MSGNKIYQIIGGLFCITFAFFLGISCCYTLNATSDLYQYDSLSVTLDRPAELVRPSRGSNSWAFVFREYPDIAFNVWAYCCSAHVPDLKAGDTARIVILKEEYRRMLLKKGNFFERLVSKCPTLYSLNNDGKEYINKKKILDDTLDPIIYYVFVIFVVLIFFSGGVDAIYKAIWHRVIFFKNKIRMFFILDNFCFLKNMRFNF